MKIYPVIHHLDSATSLGQAALAQACGADGVFLISHGEQDHLLPGLASVIKRQHPNLSVGVNLLSRAASQAVDLARAHQLDMVWLDNAGVSSRGVTEEGRYLESCLASSMLPLQIFAGVAFKHQAPEPDPAAAAREAKAAGFIPTTSGVATGQAPDIHKIQTMSKAADGELAVASGITPANVAQYHPFVSHVLVATGIGLDFHHLDANALSELIRVARELST